MELCHIHLNQLEPAKVNVRHSKTKPELDDLLPSVKERGILQPLLVRLSPNSNGTKRFEVVAGRRRYHAALAVQEETGEFEPVPCAIMSEGDDQAAIEASLLENVARLPMDPMEQYEAFKKLSDQNKAIDEIANSFGVTELHVKRILALANLIAPIKTAYRKGELDHATLQLLTLGSKTQQRDWMKLFRDENIHEPHGRNLKQWLCGGTDIKTDVALFPLGDYKGELIKDLFAEDIIFADSDQFWALQEQAIADRSAQFLEEGWSNIETLERGAYFATWEYVSCNKDDGGKVIIEVKHSGEVIFHGGYISQAEYRARERAATKANGDVDTNSEAKPNVRPETTKAMQRYLELHRHAMVREDLLTRPDMALCLIAAHMITGSRLWRIEPELQKAPTDEIMISVKASPAQTFFDKEREEILQLLDLDGSQSTVINPSIDDEPTVMIFIKLLKLSKDNVMRILIYLMAETLQSGTCVIEALGVLMGTKPRARWEADDIFLDLLKDKTAINAVLSDIAGPVVADGNQKATGKLQKSIISDCLHGQNGRKKIEDWTPLWLNFPFQSYTDKPIETTSIGADWQSAQPYLD